MAPARQSCSNGGPAEGLASFKKHPIPGRLLRASKLAFAKPLSTWVSTECVLVCIGLGCAFGSTLGGRNYGSMMFSVCQNNHWQGSAVQTNQIHSRNIRRSCTNGDAEVHSSKAEVPESSEHTAQASGQMKAKSLRPRVRASTGRVVALLGLGYALGSGLWLCHYGPKMLRFCSATPWLGKRVHRVIQAELLPDYFAFQTLSCMVALVGHGLSTSKQHDAGKRQVVAWVSVVIAVATALLNWLALCPKSVQLVHAWPKAEPTQQFMNQFKVVHGVSMLLNLLNMLASLVYIAVCGVKF